MKRYGRPTRMFRSVLCPVDFSAHARQALRHAVAIARRSGGRVTVLYVNDPLLTAAAAATADGASLSRTSAAELKQFVRQAVGPRDAARIARHTAVGEPAREILRKARRLRADLVVLGTHGLRGPARLFLGSTTERVLRQTTTPILAIPPAVGRGGVAKGWPGRRMLAAIDLDADGSSDTHAAAAVARALGLPLTLVHIVEPGRVPPWLNEFLRHDNQARTRRAREALTRLAGLLGSDLDVDTRVLVGTPGEQIASAADAAGAGLIVLALRRGDGIFGAAQGSITYRVLSSGCSIPVLAVPTRRRASRSRSARATGVQLDPSAFT